MGDVLIKYRTTEFCIPHSWFNKYIRDLDVVRASQDPSFSYGYVTSREESLPYLWPFYWAAQETSGASWSILTDLIGCYNLPKEDIDLNKYLFWYSGWGAPHAFYLHTLMLALTYSEYISDPSDSYEDLPLQKFVSKGAYIKNVFCEGFNDFVRKLLQGKRAKSKQLYSYDVYGNIFVDVYSRNCKLVVNFRNNHAEGVVKSECNGDSMECSPFKKSECNGIEWDNWGISWDENGSRWYFIDSTGDVTPRPPSAKGCQDDGYANNATYSINLHPSHLGSYGFLFDYLMFLSKIAYDFYRNGGGGSEYVIAAWNMAKYALRLLVEYGHLVIHEIGHLYMNTGGHCDYSCCFDIAATQWKYKVIGKLGLPINGFSVGYVEVSEGNYEPDDYPYIDISAFSVGEGGGNDDDGDNDVSCDYRYSYTVHHVGEVNTDTEVCVNEMLCIDNKTGENHSKEDGSYRSCDEY